MLAKAKKIGSALPSEYKDAYYQLVLHPVEASANLNELYVTVAKNRFYAKQGNPAANGLADKAKQLYIKNSLISKYYNDTLAGGKWRHMMDQTHIGYTYWQQPPNNTMPEVQYVNTAANATSISNVKFNEDNSTKSSSDKTPTNVSGGVFVETGGYVSIEAEHFSKAVNTEQIKWQVIPNLGRTVSAVEAIPVTAPSQSISPTTPRLEYNIWVSKAASAKVHTYLSPTLNFHNRGLRFAISFDNEKPTIIDMHEGYTNGLWNKWVAENIVEKVSEHLISKPGAHVIKFWMIDPAVVLQKIVIDMGGLKPSYLGPQETKIK